MKMNIALLKGDGIGPEIIDEAVKVLNAVGKKFGHTFEYTDLPIGGYAIDNYGLPLPDETVTGCKAADAVMLGAVGGPKWDAMPPEKRPEKGLLGIRKALSLYANLRPVKLFPPLAFASPIRADIRDKGIDLVIVRELTGGIYFGKKSESVSGGKAVALDECVYSEEEIDRLLKVGFDLAGRRGKKICLVDKANVLKTSALWRKRFYEIGGNYPDIEKSVMLVDNAAMQLVRAPYAFDVIVTENMFGDILSDEAAVLTGSIGLIPSASLGEGGFGLYEPIHGSAPDIAGTGKANPVATILSAAMMTGTTFGLKAEAKAVENAVADALTKYRTADVYTGAEKLVSTSEMGDAVAALLENN